jgi:excisionase family DNA binding protein
MWLLIAKKENKRMTVEKRYLNVDEVTAVLNISKPHVYKLISEKTINGIKIGDSVRVPVKELERFIAEIES